MDEISSSDLFLFLSSFFPRVKFLGLITFIKFTRVKDCLQDPLGFGRGAELLIVPSWKLCSPSIRERERKRTNIETEDLFSEVRIQITRRQPDSDHIVPV